jgi:hypothetical protein
MIYARKFVWADKELYTQVVPHGECCVCLTALSYAVELSDALSLSSSMRQTDRPYSVFMHQSRPCMYLLFLRCIFIGAFWNELDVQKVRFMYTYVHSIQGLKFADPNIYLCRRPDFKFGYWTYHCQFSYCYQGSYGPWKSWKTLDFYFSPGKPLKTLEF